MIRKFINNKNILPLFTGMLLLSCTTVFYYPSRDRDKKAPSYKYEDIFIKSKSGNMLNIWYFPAENPSGLVLFFHGNARNISYLYESFLWLVDKGYDYILFDYSGYGRSTGSPTGKNLHLDSQSMLEYGIKLKKVKNYPLIAIGQSLGGAVLLASSGDFKGRKEIDLIIADCTFNSYIELADYHIKEKILLPLPSRLLLISDRYAPARFIHKLKGIPMLVSHCREDRTVPFFLGKKLHSLLPGPSWFWELSCRHTAGFWRSENRERLVEFIEKQVN
jgi:fermentation-respiration switch protein FrsA (DUF1100 family)